MAVSAELILKRKELEAKQDKLKAIFKEAGEELDLNKVASLTGDSKAKAAEIKKMNDELSDLGKSVDALVDLENAAKDTKAREKDIELAASKGITIPTETTAKKSIGEQFSESPEFKGYKGGKVMKEFGDFQLKTAMTTAAGFAPESLRTGEVVPYVRRPPMILDMINVRPTSMAAVVYMEQTTRTNNATEVAENGTNTDVAMAWTERSATIQEVLAWVPVTGQQMEDVPQIQSIINDELNQMIRERLDYQIVNGTGVSPYIAGLNATGCPSIQTRAFASDWFDTIFNAMKDVRVTGRSTPSAIIMHPTNFAEMRLARTEDGLYILGNPNELVDRIWGIQVVQSDAITVNKALVGAFADWTKLYEKRGITIEITDSHDTYFIYGKYAIRATVRVALVTTRQTGFCLISK